MPNSAKYPTDLPKAGNRTREELVTAARKHVGDGGTAAEFAKKHGLPRTTVIGWCSEGHVGSRGRRRKLDAFDETEVLKFLLASDGLHTWKTISEHVRKRSPEVLQRRSIFRLLTKLGLNAEPADAGGVMLISTSVWTQPPETLDGSNPELRGTIWRVMSGRGMECFMLTDDDSDGSAEKVADTIMKRFEDRKRRRQLRINHPGLAKAVREKLKGWQVHTAVM